MFDLFFGEKLFNSVINNPNIKNKFWGYFWRGALIIAGGIAIVFFLVFALAAVMQGEFVLSPPMFLILLAALLLISIITPIIQFFLWRDGRKKKK